MSEEPRQIELLVLSDLHLGTYGCHAKELLNYLKVIKPKKVILNGDIIDIWQFSKKYWPASHMKVIKRIMKWIADGVPVWYITGNHDEMLRKFEGFELGSFKVKNKLVLELSGKKAWFFHGDVFDVVMKHSKWLAKLGAVGYDMLILINRLVNRVVQKLGGEKISLSKRVKNSVKGAVKFVNNFEETVADIAIDNKFDFVVCGHIHQPVQKEFRTEKGSVVYLNSGDWVENLSALEYHEKEWSIYHYGTRLEEKEQKEDLESLEANVQTTKELFGLLQEEFSEFLTKEAS